MFVRMSELRLRQTHWVLNCTTVRVIGGHRGHEVVVLERGKGLLEESNGCCRWVYMAWRRCRNG